MDHRTWLALEETLLFLFGMPGVLPGWFMETTPPEQKQSDFAEI